MGSFPRLEAPLGDGTIELRRWYHRDARPLCAMADDAEIVRWTLIPSPYRKKDAYDWFELTRGAWAAGERAAFAVVRAGGDELLGSIDLRASDPQAGAGEIGYMVGPAARGRGVATRAVRVLTEWGFAACGIERIEIFVEPDNAASRRVAFGAGFREEGVLRRYHANRYGDHVDVALLARMRIE